jgi:hypothetical protein
MITNAILYFLYYFLVVITTPLRVLSDVSLSSDISAAISSLNTYISAMDFIFPVNTFLIVFGVILTLEGFIAIYKLIMWVIRKIPGVN